MRDPARYLHFAIATILLSAGAAAQDATPGTTDAAEERRYAVEIILFRYADGVSGGNEVFPPEPLPVDPLLPGIPGMGDEPDHAVTDNNVAGTESGDEIDTAPARVFGDRVSPGESASSRPGGEAEVLREIVLPLQRAGVQVTPREALTLEETFNKLELLDAYEPVLWTGWSQAALPEGIAPAVDLRRLGNVVPEFDGTFKLYLGRFLHLVVDLTLTPRGQRVPETALPLATFGDARTRNERLANRPEPRDRRVGESAPGYGDTATGLVRLRINEDRIVKNGDLRYFDHPRFGLLAKITRIEMPEEVPVGDNEVLPAPR